MRKFIHWYEPAKYETLVGQDMTYDEICNGDLISVESMRAIDRLGVGEEHRGVEVEPPPGGKRPMSFTVRRIS